MTKRGATMTIIPEDVYKEKLSHVELQECSYNFNTYNNEQLPIKGQAEVDVSYKNQRCTLPIIVAGVQNQPPVFTKEEIGFTIQN